MVVLIPMPSISSGGAGPWRDRPSLIGLGISTVFLAGYFTLPLYNRALFIDLPQAFGIQVSTSGIQAMSILLGFVFGAAYVFSTFFTLMGAETVRWWEWTLFSLSFLAVLFWILPLVAAGNNLSADFCQEVLRTGADVWDAGCYRFLN